jgi:hypothetical protein
MNKKLEYLVDNAIDNEFNHIQGQNFTDMKEINEHEKLEDRCSELYEILMDHLPEEYRDLLEEFDSKRIECLCLESRYYFRKGVQTEILNLNYLKEAGCEITML